MAHNEVKNAKNDYIDRMRGSAEVRKRMEEASKVKIAKKGFMTPVRKQKLRLLLRKKAHEEYKKEQERKAVERKNTIEQRCRKTRDLQSANEETINNICKQYHSKIATLENEKYDLEYIVAINDEEINHLNNFVLCLCQPFSRPTLKKVNKYEKKFAEPQCRAAPTAFNYRNQLKSVKKIEFTLADEKKEKKPDWSKNKGEA